jgi:hypothetical protein
MSPNFTVFPALLKAVPIVFPIFITLSLVLPSRPLRLVSPAASSFLRCSSLNACACAFLASFSAAAAAFAAAFASAAAGSFEGLLLKRELSPDLVDEDGCLVLLLVAPGLLEDLPGPVDVGRGVPYPIVSKAAQFPDSIA